MIRFEHSVQVDQPRDRVFDFIANVENTPRYQKGVIESKPLSEGPVRVGYQFAETAKVGFWTIKNVCTVTEVRQNERLAFEATSTGPMQYSSAFELQPVAGGTRLTYSGQARLRGLWRLLQPLLAGDIRKEVRDGLSGIKRILESEAAAPGVQQAQS